MADYQKMYFTLFNKVSDVIEELEEVQQLAEEMYLADTDKASMVLLSEPNKGRFHAANPR